MNNLVRFATSIERVSPQYVRRDTHTNIQNIETHTHIHIQITAYSGKIMWCITVFSIAAKIVTEVTESEQETIKQLKQ